MAFHDYRCNKCGFIEEYNNSFSLPESFKPPKDMKCPSCNEGSLEIIFSTKGQSFDIIGYCYMNEYGKHAWKKNLSKVEQAKVLTRERDPY